MRDVQFTGFCICEELRIVFTFASSHADKRGAIDAARRYAADTFGTYTTDVHAFNAASQDGENYLELAQHAAQDSVCGTDGRDDGYTFVSEPAHLEPDTRLTAVGEIASAYGASRALVSALFDAYQGAAREYANDDEFAAMAARMLEYRRARF